MEAGPKLLLSTAPFYRFPLRTAFGHAREAGFRAVEVMVTSDPATQDAASIRALAGEFELAVEALHAPFLLMTRRVWSTDPIEKIYRSTQVAESAEIPLIVVHPPYRWQTRYRRWVGSSLADYSARSGVRIAVENMFPIKIRGDRGLRFHASQDFEDLDGFPQLALDTSHLAVAGFDILQAFDRYRDKVAHFHLSNNAGKGWDSHLPVDEGVLPIGELLEKAVEEGFQGSMSLELDLRPYLEDGITLREVLVRNREFCESRLGVRT